MHSLSSIQGRNIINFFVSNDTDILQARTKTLIFNNLQSYFAILVSDSGLLEKNVFPKKNLIMMSLKTSIILG